MKKGLFPITLGEAVAMTTNLPHSHEGGGGHHHHLHPKNVKHSSGPPPTAKSGPVVRKMQMGGGPRR